MKYRLKVRRVRMDILYFEGEADSKDQIITDYWSGNGDYFDSDAVDIENEDESYDVLMVTEVEEDE